LLFLEDQWSCSGSPSLISPLEEFEAIIFDGRGLPAGWSAAMDKLQKATQIVGDILEEVSGVVYDPHLDLGELDEWEELMNCTESAFGLSDDWAREGEKVSSTLEVFVEYVSSLWNGETINEDWASSLDGDLDEDE
jgi:hypothetical protein